MRKSVSGWIPDWFPKVEKEESRKWEPVDGIQEKITDGQTDNSFLCGRLLGSSLPLSISRAKEKKSDTRMKRLDTGAPKKGRERRMLLCLRVLTGS